MKFYRVEWKYEDERDGSYDWVTTKRDAERMMRDNMAIFEADEKYHKITEVNVPTDKAGLLEWLVENVLTYRTY